MCTAGFSGSGPQDNYSSPMAMAQEQQQMMDQSFNDSTEASALGVPVGTGYSNSALTINPMSS